MGTLARIALGLIKKIRFSVRGLLAIVLIVGLVLGGWIVPYFGYRRQISEVKQLAGHPITRPCWQARLIGDTQTGPIVSVSFQQGMTDDASFALASRLPDLERLDISGLGMGCGMGLRGKVFRVTEAGFTRIGEMNKLRSLTLEASWSSDGVLEHVGKLAHLEELGLSQRPMNEEVTRPNGAGFAYLKPLKSLRKLTLSENWLTDEILAQIGGLAHLEELCLSRSEPSEGAFDPGGAGLASLKSLTHLRKLTLDVAGLTDDALDQVRKLAQLEELTLTRAAITDEGLHRLAGLDRLRSLTLGWSNIDGGGLDYLQELPGLRVLHLIANGNLDDWAYAHLAGAIQIRKLVLDRLVDDKDLHHLKSMSHLETIDFRSDGWPQSFTREQLDDLKSALATTEILDRGSPFKPEMAGAQASSAGSGFR